MIVVEGADNSGKSTFAKALGLSYFTAGPAPKDVTELQRCLIEQKNRASNPCVQDRLTCISQQVYSEAPESGILQRDLDEMVTLPMVIVVYCRPPERVLMDLSNHKVKSYDTEENLEKIARNQHEYIRRYDEVMARIPHILYDWTEFRDYEPANLNALIRSLILSQYSFQEWKEMVDRIGLYPKVTM